MQHYEAVRDVVRVISILCALKFVKCKVQSRSATVRLPLNGHVATPSVCWISLSTDGLYLSVYTVL